MTVSLDSINKVFKDAEKKCIKACINTVNIQAASARQGAIANVRNNLTLRNNWTTKNILYTQCPQSVTDINAIQSEVGASDRLDYMERQEHGGERKPKSGSQLAIPNTMARGGSNQKKVLQKFHLNKMKTVGKALKATTPASRYVARAFVAQKYGLFLSLNKSLFIVSNFVRSGGLVHFKQTPIYNLKFESTTTPSKPWLKPAADAQAEDAQSIYNYQLDKLFNS